MPIYINQHFSTNSTLILKHLNLPKPLSLLQVSEMAGSSQTNERSNMQIQHFPDATKVVMEKVQKMDPENVSKIVAHLLAQDHSEQEMMNLAHVSDNMFMSLIEKTREDLNLPPQTIQKDKQPNGSKLSTNFTPFTPSSSRFPRAPPVNNVQIDNYAPMIQPVFNNFDYAPVAYFSPPSNVVGFYHHPQFMPMEAQMEHGFHNVTEGAWNAGPTRGPVFPGMRFYQRHNGGYYLKEEAGDSPMPVWIKKLELELVGILKSKGPFPIPIACLPALYSANFGQQVLNAMRAKVGSSLPDVLAQMSRRIRLFERPSGELCVMLAEDIPKFVKAVEERKERVLAEDLSRQIFLTFCSKCTFTSQDVYDYFSTIGPVTAVKIPYNQPKRMFGFVTFTYAATADAVLCMNTPHYIRDMQVLAKEYTGEQILDRKASDFIRYSVWSLTNEDSHRLAKMRLGFTPKRRPTIEDFAESGSISSSPIPGIRIEDTISSSYIPPIHTGAGPSAPTGIPIGSADKGKSIVTDATQERFNKMCKRMWAAACEEARFNEKRENIWTGASGEASFNGKGKSIWTDAVGEARSNDKGKSIWTEAVGEASYNGKGKTIWTGADGEASYNGMTMWTGAAGEARINDKGKSKVTDANEEAGYDDDINLPDSPFAFEASQYDFSSMNDASQYDFSSMPGGSEWWINDSEL